MRACVRAGNCTLERDPWPLTTPSIRHRRTPVLNSRRERDDRFTPFFSPFRTNHVPSRRPHSACAPVARGRLSRAFVLALHRSSRIAMAACEVQSLLLPAQRRWYSWNTSPLFVSRSIYLCASNLVCDTESNPPPHPPAPFVFLAAMRPPRPSFSPRAPTHNNNNRLRGGGRRPAPNNPQGGNVGGDAERLDPGLLRRRRSPFGTSKRQQQQQWCRQWRYGFDQRATSGIL